jgi:UDP-glucose 4-epimerase
LGNSINEIDSTNSIDTLVPKPLSPYGASKLSCEGYCSAFYNSYGLKTVILRFSNVYGPYSLHKNSVIAKFIKDGITKGEVTIYGDGTQTRDFIHVDDLCHAISLLLSSAFSRYSIKVSPNSTWGEIFHLGTGIETSILDLAKLIQKFFNDEITISYAPKRKGEIKRTYSDTIKAQNILGFSLQISLRDGAKEVYEWLKTINVVDVKNAQMRSGSA